MDEMNFEIVAKKGSTVLNLVISGFLYHYSLDGTPFFSYWTMDMQSPSEYVTLDLRDYSVYFIVRP